MTMPSENRADPNQSEGNQVSRQISRAQAETNEARAANLAAYVSPPTPRRWGGRVILGMQKMVNKVLAGRVVQIQEQVIDQDTELSELAHDMGELSAQVVQMNRMLRSIDERLARLEATNKLPDPK
jgi:hypothetical protein